MKLFVRFAVVSAMFFPIVFSIPTAHAQRDYHVAIFGEKANLFNTSDSPSSPAQTFDVAVNGNFFAPDALTINAGDTVRWTWTGSRPHTVTSGACDGGGTCTADDLFCSPNDANCATAPASGGGAIYTHTFNQAGTFPYFCRIHGAMMTGTVTVNAPPPSCATTADYQFQNSRSSSAGAAPALSDIGAGNAFIPDNVAGTSRPVMLFSQGDGLQLQPTTGTIANDAYTIVALFKFANVNGYRRIFDFKNGTSDTGLYVSDGNLNFYNAAGGSGSPIAANTYVQVVLTRTSVGIVTGYVNGVQQFSFDDSANGLAVIDSNNALRFFKDNASGGVSGEESGGTVARIRLINCALSAAAVVALDLLPSTCTPSAVGLQSWYAGDGDALDSRSRNNATLNNGATFAAGKVGQGFAFDGVDDYVEMPNAPSNSNAAGTWEFWFKTSQPDTPNGAGLIGKHDGSASLNGITVFINLGKLGVQIKPGSNTALSLAGASVINDGQFHHAALTFQSGGAASLYIDGNLADTGTAPSFSFGSNPIRLGRLLDNYWNAYNGLIDEFSIYSRALSPAEIAAIYNAGQNGKCKPTATAPPPNQVMWLAGDGNPNDVSGNGNDGSPQGGTGYSVGKVGQGFALDGADDFINVPDAASLEVSNQLTLEAWIKPTDTNNFRQIISKFGANGNYAYQIGLAPNGALRTDLSQNGTAYEQLSSPAGAITANAWNHVAVTFNGGATSLYVNGSQAASAKLPIISIFSGGNTNVNVGRDPIGIQNFAGQIDEAAIYSRALSAAEIASIYNAGVAGKLKQTFTGQPAFGAPEGIIFSVLVGDAQVFFPSITSNGFTQEIPLPESVLPALPFTNYFTGLQYDIATSAGYGGNPQVCFNLPAFTPEQFANLRIYHLEPNGWQNRTGTGNYPSLCTNGLTSLSPFAIALNIPTAASASIGGRVRSASGKGIAQATVTLTNAGGATRTARTNQFGRYRFDDVPSGATYIISVSRRFTNFAQPAQVRFVGEDDFGIDFVEIE